MSWLLHVDLDQFLAAVEFRRRPELRDRPLVVGSGAGDPERARAVVMCASYVAREHGVHAGQPLRAAARRCPDAVFLPADADECERASTQVMDVLRTFGPVEVLGWDEAFVGAGDADPVALAHAVLAAVPVATGLDCSVGVGDSRQRAKLATAFGKPRGVFRLDDGNWSATMDHRPVDALWGVGPRIAASLGELGIRTVADLAAADPDVLRARYGPTGGPRLGDLGRGGTDTGLVTEPREPRSRSRQTTFETDVDVTDAAENVSEWPRSRRTTQTRPLRHILLERRIAALAVELAGEVVAEHAVAKVLVTVRTASFWTRTRSRTLPEPTRDVAVLEAAARLVLSRFTITRPVRLVGVGLEFAPR